jgi:hypothetical protein
MPKVIEPEADFGRRELLGFGDNIWAKISCHIPSELSAAADAQLRAGVGDCVGWLLTQGNRIQQGRKLAANTARIKRLAKKLQSAKDDLAKVGSIQDADNALDHRRGLDRGLDALAGGAAELAARKSVAVPQPWPEFVRKLARCCRDVGLKPIATGRGYEGVEPTWFQNFVLAIQRELLGDDGRKPHSPEAFAAEIAVALRGEKNSRKSRK